MQKVSIVIPAYRSKDSLPILVERIENVLTTDEIDYEVIIIDDFSPDDTWEVLIKLKKIYERLIIIRLLRNSGQHNAILCGFSIAKGDIIVTMDDDLQNPPEEIPKLIAAINQGYDLAIGAYDSKKHSIRRNVGGNFVDAIQRNIFKLPKNFQLTSFRAIRKVVVENVNSMSAVYPYITSMLLSHTSSYTNVPVHHDLRIFGKSNYDFNKSISLAFNLLLNYSNYPLYLVLFFCLAALGFSVLLGAIVIWKALFIGISISGWASTIVVITFFNALILFALVIHSLFLSRLNQQLTRSRVSFTIGEIHE